MFQVIIEFYTVMETDDINFCEFCGAYFSLKILHIILNDNPGCSNHSDIKVTGGDFIFNVSDLLISQFHWIP